MKRFMAKARTGTEKHPKGPVRTDLLFHAMNAGKKERARALFRAWRLCAVAIAREQAGVLRVLVRQHAERWYGPRGRPGDPRWTNPYFKEWCASVTSMLPTMAAPLHGAARQ